MRLSRRHFAAAAASAGVSAAQTPSQTPSGTETASGAEEQSARETNRRNAAALRQTQISISTEPSFQFKA